MAEDCTHPKRMMINNVPYCLSCKEYLYSGICTKCQRALDDHDGVALDHPVCPTVIAP